MTGSFTIKKTSTFSSLGYAHWGSYNDATGVLIYGGKDNAGGVNGLDKEGIMQATIDYLALDGTINLLDLSYHGLGIDAPDGIIVTESWKGLVRTFIKNFEHDAGSVQGLGVTDIRDHTPKVHGNEAHDPSFGPLVHYHDESDITDLDHDAQKIKGKTVDDSAIGDGKVLKYDSTEDKIIYGTGSGGLVEHGNEYHNPDFSEVGHEHKGNIVLIVGDGSNDIITGLKGAIRIPFNCQIVEWTILSTDPSELTGSIVLDIEKGTYANYPATSSICGTNKPNISNAKKGSSTDLTGWTVDINEGEVIKFEVESISVLKRVTGTLKIERI